MKERVAAVGRQAAGGNRRLRIVSRSWHRTTRSGSPGLRAENLERIDGIAATHQAYVDIGDSLESRLGELEMPVTVVHGDQDSRIPIECGHSLNDGIRQAQMYVISGAEHGLMTNEAAERTRNMIMMWLRGVQKTREAYAELERERAAETA